MSKEKKESFFWTSYSDLMTSLFFVMLILFVICVVIIQKSDPYRVSELEAENVRLKDTISELKTRVGNLRNAVAVSEAQKEKIMEIGRSIEEINKDYFNYNAEFKRHTLKDVNVSFKTNSANINDLPTTELNKLHRAGKEIVSFMKRAADSIPEAQYLLIVEGQSSRDNFVFNYELSYQRALSLVKYWIQECEIDFDNLSNCEVIISGSGQNSKFRDNPDRPPMNQRFVIHIIPKPGIVEVSKK